MSAARYPFITLALIFSCIAMAAPLAARAAVTCPNPGERPATEEDVPKMKAAGYKDDYAKVGNCWNPESKEAGASVGEAKQYLSSILCPPSDGDNYGGMGPEGTIQGLDGKFSVCAAKFLKASRDAGINVCVREGARSVAKQNQYVARGVFACKKGARCEHPRGIAIDVNVRPNVNNCGSYITLHRNAPRFGVNFYLGCRDAYHFVPLPGGDCNAGGTIQPDEDYDFPQYYTPQAPSSGIANQFRQALGMPQQPSMPATQATPAASPITSQLPQPTQSQFCLPEYKCSGNNLIYQNSFCATQVQQVCSAGCSNGACRVATSTASSTDTSTATSAIDIIGTLGSVSATSTSVGTATPLQLILGLSSDQKSTTAQGSTKPTTVIAPGSIAGMQLVGAQQTFTSNNLNQNISSVGPRDRSAVFIALENMKNVLLRALEYLRPFSISGARSSAIDGHYVE